MNKKVLTILGAVLLSLGGYLLTTGILLGQQQVGPYTFQGASQSYITVSIPILIIGCIIMLLGLRDLD